MKNKNILRFGVIAAVVLVGFFVITLLTDDTRGFQKVDTSVAMAQLKDDNVKTAQIDDREQRLRLELKDAITVEEQDGVTEILTQYPARTAPTIFDAVEGSDAESFDTHVTRDSFLMSMLSFILPMLLLFGLLMFFFSRMQRGGGGMFGIGNSKAKQLTKDMPTATFDDVAGADDAVDELQEIRDFLEDPSAYHELGAKIPRGVLLYGPPGTGKTLLARAVAGEAGVPFYTISGSDFVEMFVGVGASRVRDLFKQARENSPCIIFIDEIDAVGRQRGSGTGGGHDEREQTLNQLLVEMDGFTDREDVILIAATNRPDILDPALLRPGRFDRQIPVTAPDLAGREHILKVHAKGKPLGPDADLNALARRTAGMSGADLANVLNEAALLTARIGGNIITGDALEEATDRVVGGPRRSSKIISEKEKKVTAYHEGGHTLSAWALQDIERVHKVTILARGRTGGHAMTAAEDDKGLYTTAELFARLVFAMGGRSAEELIFGEPTTGASSDIEQATKIARAMVTEYGMSALGTVKFGEEQGDPFSGQGAGGALSYSDEVAAKIDGAVADLIDRAHQRSYELLSKHRENLDRLAERLLIKETLRRPDLEELFGDIEPEPVGDVFDVDTRFPRQDGYEPVLTPAEEAKERGEEPPKRFSLLEASRQARARRQAQKQQANKEWIGAPVAPSTTNGSARPAGGPPNYGGTPPPANWTVPGWGHPGPSQNSPQGQSSAPAGGSSAVGNPSTGAHPSAQKNQNNQPVEGVQSFGSGQGEEELIGFRLPEAEQPTRTKNDQDAQDQPEEHPQVMDEGLGGQKPEGEGNNGQ